MKPTKTLTLLLLAFSLSTVFSQSKQNEISRNSFYVEAFGTAIVYSLNYDRLLIVNEKSALAGRIGFTYAPKIGSPDLGPGVNIEITGLWGANNHHLEIGGGSTFYYLVQDEESYSPSNTSLLLLTTRVGYRFQKRDGGLLFRIGFTPLFTINVDKDISSFDRSFTPWGGISIGYTFKK